MDVTTHNRKTLCQNRFGLGVGALLILIALCATHTSAFGQERPPPPDRPAVHFITHSLGTAVYRDEFGMLRGLEGGGRRAFVIELVRAMMVEANLVTAIDEVPLPRGLALLESGKNYAFFNIVRNAERRDRFKWAGPIYEEPNFFYDHATRPSGINTLDDAKQVKGICAVRGTNIVGWFSHHGFTNIVEANSFSACLQLLNYGRVALVQSAENPLVIEDKFLAKAVHRTEVKVEDPNDTVPATGPGYIAFSPDVPDDEVARWQKALDTLKQRGDYARLRTRMLISQSDGPEGK